MKRLVLIAAIAFTSVVAHAQSAGNEWIEYEAGRYYLKIAYTTQGVYKVTQGALNFALTNAGINATIDPRTLQVFIRGVEVPLYVSGESDGTFDAGDYFEFFADTGTAWLDLSLYGESTKHTNPYYSLVNDTAAAFITWDPQGSQSGLRYSTESFNQAAPTPLSYFIAEAARPFSNAYNQGPNLGDGKAITRYVGGKGWMSDHFGYNNGQIRAGKHKDFSTRNAYTQTGAPMVEFETGLCGFNAGAGTGQDKAHHVMIQVNKNGYTTIKDVFLKSYEYKQVQVNLTATDLSSPKTRFRVETTQSGSLISTTSDYNKVAYMKLRYPHSTSFAGENKTKYNMIIPASQNPRYVNLTGWSQQLTSFAYDPVLMKRYEVTGNNGNIKFNVSAGPERLIFLSTDNEVIAVSGSDISPVNGTGRFTDYAAIGRDSAYIIITHRRLQTQSVNYINYRNNTTGNRVVAADIEELYDQFAYGIRLHPLAIKNFCAMALNTWNTPPKHLFLLGKSIEESLHRKNATYRSQCLIPTMGSPPSDWMLTMGIDGKDYAPAVATGRLAASSNGDILSYLEKVQLMEQTVLPFASAYTINKRLWQKRVLHFAGGSSGVENQTFRTFLSSYESKIDGISYGAKVYTYSKTSGSVFQQLDVDTLRELISGGVAIMTFFGHGTTSGFDINVDDPADWNNYGRYPLVIANSCFSGNIHLPDNGAETISEKYVLINDFGSIGFIATPELSYPTYLHTYTTRFYEALSVTNYGASLGEHMLATAKSLAPPNVADSLIDERLLSVCLEMTLHGDPALRLYPHQKSELSINDPEYGAALKISPETVTTDLDSFELSITITNLGKASSKEVSLTLIRSFESGKADEIYVRNAGIVTYDKTIRIKLPIDPNADVGVNKFTIQVDLPTNSIDEFDDFENNEIGSFETTIIDAGIIPIFPYPFAVVDTSDLSLKANTGYPFAPSASYTFEIDTTDRFSPPLNSATIVASGAVIEWNPQITKQFEDSTVFFWRVGPTGDTTKRSLRSFQVINGKRGWGQDHFFQYRNNNIDLLTYDPKSRKFRFDTVTRELKVNVVGMAQNDNEYFQTRYTLDGFGGDYGEYGIAKNGIPSMAIAVIDTANLKPWGTYGIYNGLLINENHQFGNSNNYNPNSSNSRDRRVEYWFSFTTTDAASLDAMVNMITNEVPDGFYLLAYTLRTAQFETGAWNNSHFAAFEMLGADSIRYVKDNHPYIFFVRKGEPQTAVEKIGDFERDIITLQQKLYSFVRQGEMFGPSIGPAMQWHEVVKKTRGYDAASGEEGSVEVIGSKPSGKGVYVGELLEDGAMSIGLSADTLREVSLSYFTQDEELGTAVQLASWHVLHEPAPDAAVNPSAGYFLSESPIKAGAPLKFALAVTNPGHYDFDSVYVRYSLLQKGKLTQSTIIGYESLRAGVTLLDTVTFETRSLSGNYTLKMEVNPKDYRWHREHFDFNNLAFQSVEIIPDRVNPLLDVTFDGVHILDGDIVSPSPVIKMRLKDDNHTLLMTDTSSFEVYLTHADGRLMRIPFERNGIPVLHFEPAKNNRNTATVTYHPDPLPDGKYELRVTGRDASGNLSGKEAYRINFEVINRSTVTHVMNYPNPFTTSTRFVFTLTGSKIPDVFTIQIMTVTGKIVREITKDELGPIRIGRNITEYAWDGTDEYGDRLANGVYLYRVITKLDGQSIDRRNTEADSYFVKDFGKMYLFR
ncbi:MAG: hypothetical protein Kow0075_00400 [Salibacteraceae bacterium]